VLGFNRSILRLSWLAGAFDAYNVQIDRDPSEIWACYMERRSRGDHTFFAFVWPHDRDRPLVAATGADLWFWVAVG
jgi:hypothetical protein